MHRIGVTIIPWLALGASAMAQAWILTVSPGPKTVYLQVGTGSYTGIYSQGGSSPQNNATVNLVSVTVPATAVGRGTPQQMTSNSTTSNSFYDNFAICNPPAQVYVGAWARLPSGTGTAVLSVTSPPSLTAGTAAIPFTSISWTSTANGNATAHIPAGTFSGGTQVLTNIAAQTWVENCLTFFYANTVIPRQGVFNGRATYSLTLP